MTGFSTKAALYSSKIMTGLVSKIVNGSSKTSKQTNNNKPPTTTKTTQILQGDFTILSNQFSLPLKKLLIMVHILSMALKIVKRVQLCKKMLTKVHKCRSAHILPMQSSKAQRMQMCSCLHPFVCVHHSQMHYKRISTSKMVIIRNVMVFCLMYVLKYQRRQKEQLGHY